MADLKPLTLYRYDVGALSPNPWKVAIILTELSLPYTVATLPYTDPDVRTKEPLVSLSPNGRMPCLVDPNHPEGEIKLWESGAIIEYLIDVYDTEGKLSYSGFPERYQQNCWKHFQMSGQGPYFGQLNWFKFLHDSPLPEVQTRYATELRRILSVLNTHLTRTNTPYLLGPRISYVDLMFVPWNWQALKISMGADFAEEWKRDYPKCWEWNERLFARESCRRVEEACLRDWNEGAGKVAGWFLKSHSGGVDVPKE